MKEAGIRTPRDDIYILMWNFYDPLYFSGPGRTANGRGPLQGRPHVAAQ